MVKVRSDMTGWKMSEHGFPKSRLIVIKQAEDYVNPKGVHYAQWECKCKCGNPEHIIVSASHLKDGHTQSCGCLNIEAHIHGNNYDLSGDYGIGYIGDEEFWFDKEDYDLIKNYTWYKDRDGYIVSDTHNLRTKLHRLILNPSKEFDIDHIHGNKTRHDNRKSNLRICTRSQNCRNKVDMSNNTSGCIGVVWSKAANKWMARITVNKENIYLGLFINKSDAIKARIDAEKKYFKDFAPIRNGGNI